MDPTTAPTNPLTKVNPSRYFSIWSHVCSYRNPLQSEIPTPSPPSRVLPPLFLIFLHPPIGLPYPCFFIPFTTQVFLPVVEVSYNDSPVYFTSISSFVTETVVSLLDLPSSKVSRYPSHRVNLTQLFFYPSLSLSLQRGRKRRGVVSAGVVPKRGVVGLRNRSTETCTELN